MKLTHGTEICHICGKTNSVIYCDGCGKALCMKCRRFTLWNESCGSGHAKVFCEPCCDDERINPYGGKME